MFNIDAYLQIPTEDDILKHAPALPSANLPSDHLMLSCDLSFGGAKDTGRFTNNNGMGKTRGKGWIRR